MRLYPIILCFLSLSVMADDDFMALFDNSPTTQKRVVSMNPKGYKEYSYYKRPWQESTKGIFVGVSEKEWDLGEQHFIIVKDIESKKHLQGEQIEFYAYSKNNETVIYNISPAFTYSQEENRFLYSPNIIDLKPDTYLFHIYIKNKEDFYNTDFEVNVVPHGK